MKITKYAHSCVLVEENDSTILIDPGMYTYNDKVLTPSALQKLDYLLITHSHSDHMYIPFIQELVAQFPNLTIIINQEAKDLLQKEGITATTTGIDSITLTDIQHEKSFGATVPQNTQFDVFGKFTHPGDSLHSNTIKDVIALPIQAPWGSTTLAVETAEKLKPKVIIPIHDWHWKDEVRKTMYARLEVYFEQIHIVFAKLNDGETITL